MLRHTVVKHQIVKSRGLSACRRVILGRRRKAQRDRFLRSLIDSRDESATGSFPQECLKIWRLLYKSEFRDQFSTLKPEYDKIYIITEQVQVILQHLNARDERFSFIYSALEEFVNGNDGIKKACAGLDRIIYTDPNELEDDVAMEKLSEFLTEATSIPKRDPADSLNSKKALDEIIASTIYEILNVFQDITVEQPPIGPDLSTRFELLCDLYTRAEHAKPRPTVQVAPKSQQDSVNGADCQYSARLNSIAGEVRVLKILPSNLSKDKRIQCRLLVYNLYRDGIPEALSYVWGKDWSKEEILVDGKLFRVTKNLYRILHGLRRPNTTREIWIDAICINQSDSKEKAEQVRLMRDIYSKAKNTVIWLSGGQTTDGERGSTRNRPEKWENQREDPSFDIERWYPPFPPGLGRIDINQYDLTAILRECLKYSVNDPWNEEQWVLYLMLGRCVSLIQMHSWWERVWTIQEAACPPNAPIFFFQGYSFSFEDFTAAMNIIVKGSNKNEHIANQMDNWRNIIKNPDVRQTIDTIIGTGLILHRPSLFDYRRGSEEERHSAVKSFPVLLKMAETYRATNPRDKIFALQSLLPRCLGLLINVDYQESCQAVFKRATARYYNACPSFVLMETYRFWFESPLSAKEPVGPSWILDLTYTGACNHGSKLVKAKDKVTLDGFIAENGIPILEIEYGQEDMRFCTPKVLFCPGKFIDQICLVIEFPNFGDAMSIAPSTALMSLVVEVITARDSILDMATESNHNSGIGRFLSLSNFFLMQEKEPPRLENYEEYITIRNEEIAGKPIFITQRGLVGIATAPVEPGDVLTLPQDSPIYLLLREVGYPVNGSDDERQHRIVARAAVNDGLVHGVRDLEALVDLTPSRRLKIV
ncbi:HET-domain-containing protein [Hypoxylon trugodes]|uniref:HET-domain-containing protein n=1 Tax=Hypoxylon trugodes TaxID=326681 RepID=UPI00218FF3B5|nr:HET-domain-containing protein [Hypoxylon trugodes]KAI1393338.1 HET-domain-containing protein [Hypoxylon trugodes]